jgi:hypothetical protein
METSLRILESFSRVLMGSDLITLTNRDGPLNATLAMEVNTLENRVPEDP